MCLSRCVISSSDMLWQILSNQIPASPDELKEVLLANRKITDKKAFFTPLSPLQLSVSDVDIDQTQLTLALDRIILAKDAGQTIVVFGDYDVDGICATTIMCRLLLASGCSKVVSFIPDRLKHGYGLSDKAIDDVLVGEKPDLVITVDNGIVAHGPVKRLMGLGIDVIVTDHHAPETDAVSDQPLLPVATAVVHTTALCGSTVAWMVGRELEKRVHKTDSQAERLLDLCGMATICDQVQLVAANRSFAWWGIKALQTTQRPGILALIETGRVKQADVTVETVNYVLGPRINAMGRLEHGQQAFDLLWTGSLIKAKSLADSVSDTNVRRQSLTQEMLDDARTQAQSWETDHIILVHSHSYHEGVIGLIAGKLVEEFHKPAIVLAVNQTHAKASARSIAGVNIIELIREVRADLLEVGGHPGAAGFSVLPEKIAVIHEKLRMIARQRISSKALIPQQIVECLVEPKLVEHPVAEETVTCLEQFEPTGQGNAKPIIGLTKMRILEVGTIGNQDQHLKLVVAHQDSVQPVTCLGWGKGKLVRQLSRGDLISVAGRLEINRWQHRRSVQLILADLPAV